MTSLEKLFLLLTFWVEIHWKLLFMAQTEFANAQFCGSTWLNILCETLFLILSPNSPLGSCWTLMKTAYCSYTKHNTLLFNLFRLRLNSAPSKVPSPCKMSEFLWKPQPSAWIYDNNHTGRWHCNHLSLLCVQKNVFTVSSFSNTPSGQKEILKHT